MQAVGVEKAASAAKDALEEGRHRVALIGPEGTGKSRALDSIESSSSDRVVLRVVLPRRGDDAAVVGLATLAAQLEQWDDAIVSALRGGSVRWESMLERTLSVLSKLTDRALVLMDDPMRGQPAEPPSVFSRHVDQLGQSILSLDALDVVIATRSQHGLPAARVIKLVAESEPKVELSRRDWSPRFRDAAKKLCLSADWIPRLARYGPLELRLIVACVADGRAPEEFVARRWEPREIVLAALAGREPGRIRLRSLLGKLALARTPFDDELLARLGVSALPATERELLEQLLLLAKPGGKVLHHLIGRHAIAQGWSDEPSEVTHRVLAEWHRARFARIGPQQAVTDAVRHEIEVIHHLTEARDVDAVLGASPFFVDQYDALGKALSVSKRYADAVTAYERALEHDAEDAYAHHYLAYNLDWLARDEPRIEAEYERARELDCGHVWYHGRLICFQITVGRMDAALDAWGQALADLAYNDEPHVAEELHRNVAHLLLHRGQLAFAGRVLNSVPDGLREQAWFVALQGRLEAMLEAEREELVFPPVIPTDHRWNGPHLLRDPNDRERVSEWMPGRVASHDEKGLRIRFAKRDEQGVRFFYRSLSAQELERIGGPAGRRFSLPAGTFVELLTLQDGSKHLLSWQRQAVTVPNLGPILPPPDRFLRSAFTRPRS